MFKKDFEIICRIKEIINERCIVKPHIIQYQNCCWIPKEKEKPVDGFKRAYFEEYKKEFDNIFDEIHPY